MASGLKLELSRARRADSQSCHAAQRLLMARSLVGSSPRAREALDRTKPAAGTVVPSSQPEPTPHAVEGMKFC